MKEHLIRFVVRTKIDLDVDRKVLKKKGQELKTKLKSMIQNTQNI